MCASSYEWEKTVASYEVDADYRLRRSVIQKLMQETGDRHTAVQGLPYEELLQRGVAILIARSAVEVHRYPAMRERLSIRTIQRGVRGARLYRDFILRVGDEVVIEATNEYFCADMHTHKVLRPSALLDLGIKTQPDFVPRNRQPGKIDFRVQMQPAGEREIRRSDLDYNRHLNNAVYADIADDAFPANACGKPLAFYELHFLHESRVGERIRLMAGEAEEAVYVRGEKEGETAFAMRGLFEKPIDAKA